MTAVVNRYGRSFKAELVETKRLIVAGVDDLFHGENKSKHICGEGWQVLIDKIVTVAI